MPTSPEVRTLAGPDAYPEWLRAVSTGFFRGPGAVGEQEVAVRALDTDLDRIQGAYDGGRCVGTFRTLPQSLTVPGGALLPACAVSSVTVSPTHRRRGLLSRMTANALDAAKERGEVCATLVAAEYPIYGRYGFGPATWTTDREVLVARTGLDRRYSGPADLGDGGRVDLVDAAEFRALMPAVHERFRTGRHRQGAIDRRTKWWRTATGELRFPDDGFTPAFHAVYRDADGQPQGGVSYTSDDVWQAKQPEQTLTVRDLFATTTAGETALWRFVLAVDWVLRVRTGCRAPDDILPMLLPDPRAARTVTHADWLWLRPLDVPRMLAARDYAAGGHAGAGGARRGRLRERALRAGDRRATGRGPVCGHPGGPGGLAGRPRAGRPLPGRRVGRAVGGAGTAGRAPRGGGGAGGDAVPYGAAAVVPGHVLGGRVQFRAAGSGRRLPGSFPTGLRSSGARSPGCRRQAAFPVAWVDGWGRRHDGGRRATLCARSGRPPAGRPSGVQGCSSSVASTRAPAVLHPVCRALRPMLSSRKPTRPRTP